MVSIARARKWTVLVVALLAPTLRPVDAQVSIVHLTGGGQIQGRVLEENERSIKVEIWPGSVLGLEKDQVLRIEPLDPRIYVETRRRHLGADDVEARLDLARWCDEMGLADLSRELTAEAVRVDPRDPGVRELARTHGVAVPEPPRAAFSEAHDLMMRGWERVMEGRKEGPRGREKVREGLRAIEDSLRIRPEDKNAHYFKIEGYRALGDLSGAQIDLETWLAAHSEDSSAWGQLGDVQYDRGRYQESLDAFARMVELEPDTAWDRYRLALSLFALGRDDEARSALLESVRIDRSWELASELLALAVFESDPRRRGLTALYEGEHYRVWSPGAPEDARKIEECCEEALARYGIELGLDSSWTGDRRFKVFVFPTEEEFQAATGNDGALGLYRNTTRAIYLPLASDWEEMRTTLEHEVYHQVLEDLAGDASAWYDEGHAYLLSDLRADLVPGPDGGWIFLLSNEGYDILTLEGSFEPPAGAVLALLSATHSDICAPGFPEPCDVRALVFFLRRRHADVLERYLRALIDGHGELRAAEIAYESLDLEALEEEWRAFLLELAPERAELATGRAVVPGGQASAVREAMRERPVVPGGRIESVPESPSGKSPWTPIVILLSAGAAAPVVALLIARISKRSGVSIACGACRTRLSVPARAELVECPRCGSVTRVS